MAIKPSFFDWLIVKLSLLTTDKIRSFNTDYNHFFDTNHTVLPPLCKTLIFDIM